MFTGCTTALEVTGSEHQSNKHGYYVQMESGTCGDKITFRQHPSSASYIYFWDPDETWQIGTVICENSAGIKGTILHDN